MCGVVVTGKIQVPNKLLMFAKCCSYLWSLLKSAACLIFHVLVESPVGFTRHLSFGMSDCLAGFFCSHVSSDAWGTLVQPGKAKTQRIFFLKSVIDNFQSSCTRDSACGRTPAKTPKVSTSWQLMRLFDAIFADFFCTNIMQSFLTVGSTLCNALDNIGTITLSLYQSVFVFICSSVQYSVSHSLRKRQERLTHA